jgi:mannose-6-phosphate isomerase-like protein (cupin superfamily)
MAHTGQIISNPVSGETIAFRQISDECLAFDLHLTPDGHVPGMHVHPEQTERFEVVEGRMKFRLGMKTIVAGPGDVVTVPAGKAHKFANGGDESVVARVEVRPALQMAELLETTVALAEEGRTTSKGMPRPTALALFTKKFRREVRAPFPPAWVQRATLAPLGWMARKPLPVPAAA